MVKESGAFLMKTEQERELQRRVKERKEELMEMYRAQVEQRQQSRASQRLSDTTPHSRSDGAEEYTTPTDRNGMEERVGVSHVPSSLYSDRQSESHYDREVMSKPIPRMESGTNMAPCSLISFALKVPQEQRCHFFFTL